MAITKSLELSMITVVVATVAVAILLAAISESKPNTNNIPQAHTFNYDANYNDLVTSVAFVGASKTIENIHARTCFTLDSNSLAEFPATFMDSLLKARIEKVRSDHITYEGYGGLIPADQALKIISNHQFNLTKIATTNNIKKIADAWYHFDCFVEYGQDQYLLDFEFESRYPYDHNFVDVNFTRDSAGNPIITSPDVFVVLPFNSTVIFNNQLDKDVTLSITGPNFFNNGTVVTFEKMIPSGGQLSSDGPLRFTGVRNFSYQVKPYDLQGSVVSKFPSRCMSMPEAVSLYSQVGAKIEFPTYLPQGYRYTCGVEVLPWEFEYGYYSYSGSKLFDDAVRRAETGRFMEDGGITIGYMNQTIANHWTQDPNFNKLDCDKLPSNDTYTTYYACINGHQITSSYSYDGHGRQINSVSICFDHDVCYWIRSYLPVDELVKVAKSLS